MKKELLFLMTAVLLFVTANNCLAEFDLGDHQYIKNETSTTIEVSIIPKDFDNDGSEYFRMYHNGYYFDFRSNYDYKLVRLWPGERLTFRGRDEFWYGDCKLYIVISSIPLVKVALYDEDGDMQGDGYYENNELFHIELLSYHDASIIQKAKLYRGNKKLTYENGDSTIVIKEAILNNAVRL